MSDMNIVKVIIGILIFLVLFIVSNALLSALFESVVDDSTGRLIVTNISALGVATVGTVVFLIKGMAESGE